MATPPKRVYWDSCTWIALIQDEKLTLRSGAIEYRGSLCRAVIDEAKKGNVEIVSSSLVLIEVSRPPPNAASGEDKLKDFFENDYVLVIDLDRRAGERGRQLMQSGHAGLKPPDASHIASAALANVEEMHTFDDNLLKLDAKITKRDGTKLHICKPALGGKPPPLLEVLERENVEDAPNDTSSANPGGSPPTNQVTPIAEPPASIPGSSAETGVSGGRSGVQQGTEADSGGRADTETPAEKAHSKERTDSGKGGNANC